MAARTELGIMIKTLFQGKGAKDATKAMKGMGEAADKSDKRLDKMKGGLGNMAVAAGAVGAALFTAKKVFDFGKEGARIEKLENTFESLSLSVGSNATSMMNSLRTATAGMVTDVELIESANRFLAMGLAESETAASKLARTAVILGGAMGKEAGPAMEEFALLLANQSIPRLDTFGISAGKVRLRIAELKDANEDLTKEQAFMIAVNEQAEVTLGKVGDAVPIDEFTQFETHLKNVKIEAQKTVAEGLGPLVGILSGGLSLKAATRELDLYTEGWRELNKLRKAITEEAGGGFFADAESNARKILLTTRAANLLAAGYEGTDDALVEVIKSTNRYKGVLALLEEEQKAIARAAASADTKFFNMAGSIDDTTAAGAAWLEGSEDIIASTLEQNEAALKLIDTENDVAIAIREVKEEQEEARAEAEKTRRETELMVDGFGNFILKAEAVNWHVTALGDAFVVSRDQAADMSAAVLAMKNKLLGINVVAPETQKVLGEAFLEIYRAGVKVREEYERVNAELDKMAGRHETIRITTQYDQVGQPGQIPGDVEQPFTIPANPPGITYEGQHGLDFIVPPGYPSDSFPVRATSGEHVQVTPRGKGRGGNILVQQFFTIRGGGNPYTIAQEAANQAVITLGDKMRG